MKKDLLLTALVRSFVTMAFLTSSSLGVMADNPRKSATNLQFYTYVSESETRDAGFYTFNSSNPTVFTPVGNDVKCYSRCTCKKLTTDEYVCNRYAVESICWFIFACSLYYVCSEYSQLYYGTDA